MQNTEQAQIIIHRPVQLNVDGLSIQPDLRELSFTVPKQIQVTEGDILQAEGKYYRVDTIISDGYSKSVWAYETTQAPANVKF
jgi:hypothetical protein